MSRYHYRALDNHGNIVEGETTASSTKQAILALERQGLQVQSIATIDSSSLHFQSLSTDEQRQVEQVRQQAVHNAQSWSAPLLALSQEVGAGWLSKVLSRLASKLNNVNGIEQLVRDPDLAKVFPFVIKGLDASGDSDSWLMKLTRQLEVRRNQRRDLIYPIVSALMLGAILVTTAIWIIPVFEQMFAEFGLGLPTPTKVVFAVSSWIYPHTIRSLAVLTVFIALIVAVIVLLRRFDPFHRYMPILVQGSRPNLRAMAVLSLNAGELVQLKYPLPQALRLAAEGCSHTFYRSEACSMADDLETTGGPGNAQTIGRLPPMLLGFVSSGTADADSLRRLGRLYRDREQDHSRQMAMILSQLTMIAIGLIVGMVVIALFMPLIRLVSALA